MFKHHRISLGLCFLSLSLSSLAGVNDGIVVDGSTNTNVISNNTNNPIVVNIATPDGTGTSWNNYTHFNVPGAGVILNNSATATNSQIAGNISGNANITGNQANLIINNVTSLNNTTWLGQLEVAGGEANVIISNPNGIAVNGGQAINMTSLLLTTGTLTNNSNLGHTGLMNQIQVDTTQGLIDIGTGGLSGVFNSLNLVSKELRLSGQVQNQSNYASARLNIITGDSTVLTDRNALPGTTTNDFIDTFTANNGTPSGPYIINLDQMGGLTGSRISITVTNQGAGVYANEGSINSTADFNITADGDLVFEGTNFSLKGADFTASNIELNSSPQGNPYQLTSTKDITFNATGDTKLYGYGLFNLGEDLYINSNNLLIDSQGEAFSQIIGNGYFIGNITNNVDISASSLNFGRASNITANTINLNNAANWQSEDILFNVSTLNNTGALLSGINSVDITATGINQNNAANIISNDTININSTTLTNTGSLIQGINDVDIIVASNLTNQYGNGYTSKISSISGELDLDISGLLSNSSSTLQGNNLDIVADTVDNIYDPASNGYKAIIFSAGSGELLNIQANTKINNYGGRIISNGAMTLTAPIIHNITEYDSIGGMIQNDFTIKTHKSFLGLFKFGRRIRTIQQIFPGLTTLDEIPYLVSHDNMTINASNEFKNQGGEILINNTGDLNLVTNTFLNQALVTGSMILTEKCKFFCSSSASANMQLMGGNIAVAGDINITAPNSIDNVGGSILATNDMTLSSSNINNESLPIWVARNRYQGLKFWSKRTGDLYQLDKGGYITAGNILNINSTNVVSNNAGDIAATTINAPNGINTVGSRRISAPFRDRIGFFEDIFELIGVGNDI